MNWIAVLGTFVRSRVGRAQLDCPPNLRLIAVRSAGFDHIDIAAAAN